MAMFEPVKRKFHLCSFQIPTSQRNNNPDTTNYHRYLAETELSGSRDVLVANVHVTKHGKPLDSDQVVSGLWGLQNSPSASLHRDKTLLLKSVLV